MNRFLPVLLCTLIPACDAAPDTAPEPPSPVTQAADPITEPPAPVVDEPEPVTQPAEPVIAPVEEAAEAPAQPVAPGVHLSQFGNGTGPSHANGTFSVLDSARAEGQSNAVAFDLATDGAHELMSLRCKLRVLEGGDGGAFVFLNTKEFGARGPAPFVKDWMQPNLPGTFAVGIDVHDPPNEEPFGPWGNYMGLPEREVSLHWDGREIVKRVAPAEFRGDSFSEAVVNVRSVVGGAEVTVEFGGEAVFDTYFIAHLMPYEARLAIGGQTRANASTEFDVRDVRFDVGVPAAPRRRPLHVEVFNHVLTDNSKTKFEQEVTLPPTNWAFGRVILTLDIHDAGPNWDEWDRNGEISIIDADGVKRGIVPFITSYRTECHWKVDVTHFRPLLTGKTTFEIAAGTNFYKNRGYMMSVSLDFHHGTPPLEAFATVPIWVGTAKYKTAENHFSDFFDPRSVPIGTEVEAAKLFVTTTGHSQIGEFTPSKRTVIFTPDESVGEAADQRFENVLWKTDCYLNPNRPQYGTWKYSRAGWAPGDVVRPWWVDFTPHVVAGKTARLRYEPSPYDFTGAPKAPPDRQINQASHVVRAYLILYRKPEGMVPAPTLSITQVAKDSNASRAGVKTGDYLATYDGKRIDSLDDLRAAIQAAIAAGKEKIAVVVFRGGERMEMELGPGKMGVGLGSR